MILHNYTSPVADEPFTTRVRPSDWNSAHFLSQALTGNTLGASSFTGPDYFIAGSGIASVGFLGSTLVISVPAGGGAGDGGNTIAAGTRTATFSGSVLFGNANGITFGLDAPNGTLLTASHNALTSQSNQAFSGSNASSTFQTLSFNNANGASFINNAGAVELSYTVPSTAGLISAVNFSANNGGPVAATGLSFSNLNGISFGLAGSTLTAAYSVPTQTNQTEGIYASSQTFGQSSSSTHDARSLTIVGSGGINVGWSNSSLLISGQVTTPQSNQTEGIYAVGNTTGQSSSSTHDARSLSIQGAGIASVGWSNSTLIISVPSGGGAAFSAGVSNVGNTSGDTGITGTRIVFAGGNNITVSQGTDANGATITISGANAGGAQTGISGIANSETTYTSGSVTLEALGAITIRSTTGQKFQFSVNSQTNQSLGIYGSSQTFGQSSSSTYDARSLTIVGSGGISVGWSNSSFLISGQTTTPQTVQSAIKALGVSNTGNTLGNTGVSTGIDFVIAASGGITASQSTAGGGPNTIWLSVPNAVAQTVQTLGIYASSQTFGQSSSSTYDARSLSVVGSGGISVGWSNSSLLISGQTTTPQTVQTLGIYASSQTFGQSSSSTHDARSLTIVGSGGISVGWSNSSLLISGQTTTPQTVQTGGIYVTAQSTGQSSSSTYDLRTLSIVPDGIISAGWSNGSFRISATQSNQAFSAAGGASAFQTLNFADTLGMSWTNTNGSIALASLKLSMFAVSNTTQSSSGTANHSALSFGGAGIASVGVTGGTVVVSVPSAGAITLTAFANSNTTQSSTGTLAGSSLNFAGAGIASVGISNGSVVISVPSGGGAGDGGVFAGVSTFGNTAGSTGTVSTGNFVLVGSGAISLSQSTGAAGSAATVSILAPATSSLVGASGINISTNGSTISVYQDLESFYQNVDYAFNLTTQSLGNSTSVVIPFYVKEGQTADFARMFHSVTVGSTSFASTANTSYSYNAAETHNLVIYSRGTGASSLSLQSYTSTSVGFTQSVRLSRNTTNNISVTHGFTYGISNGTSSISFSYAATNSTDQFSSTHLTALTAIKQWDTQFGLSLLPGRYWMVYGYSSTQTTQQTAALSAVRLQHSQLGVTQPNSNIGFFGSAANASIQWQLGIGSFTRAGGTTASIDASAISSSASHLVPYLQLLRIA